MGDNGNGVYFNADDEATGREARTYIIGGKTFKPVRVTTVVNRQLNQVAAEYEQVEQEHGADSPQARDADDAGTLRQLQLLLRDTDGKPPAKKLLEENLDVRDIVPILRRLRGVGDPEGPSVPPADPSAATSTTT